MTIFNEKCINAIQSDWRLDQRRDPDAVRQEIGPTNTQTLPANFWSDRQPSGWGKNSPIWAITRADLWSI